MRLSLDPHPQPVTVCLDCDTAPEGERIEWTLRPLTGPESDAVHEAAGPVPLHLLPGYNAACAGEELTPEQLAESKAFEAWALGKALAFARRSLVAVNGEPVTDADAVLASIRPVQMWRTAALELGTAVMELTALDPKARDSYRLRCGCGGTPTAEGGIAETATENPSS
jgi:hypothetical protein